MLGGMIKKPFKQCKTMSISCQNLKTIRAFIQNRPGTLQGVGPERAVPSERSLLKKKRKKNVSTNRRGKFLHTIQLQLNEECKSMSSLEIGNLISKSRLRELRGIKMYSPLRLSWTHGFWCLRTSMPRKEHSLPRKYSKLL